MHHHSITQHLHTNTCMCSTQNFSTRQQMELEYMTTGTFTLQLILLIQYIIVVIQCHLHSNGWWQQESFSNDLSSANLAESVIFTCDSIYAIARICLANSVRPSVTRVNCIKKAECIIKILSPSDRPIILVFRHQGSLHKSDGSTPNGGAEYKGVAIFDQYAAISLKR